MASSQTIHSPGQSRARFARRRIAWLIGPLRRRFLILLLLLAGLSLAPLPLAWRARAELSGHARQIDAAGALRTGLTAIDSAILRGDGAGVRRLVDEQSAGLATIESGDPRRGLPPCAETAICARAARHRGYWQRILAPAIEAARAERSAQPAAHALIARELAEVDRTVRFLTDCEEDAVSSLVRHALLAGSGGVIAVLLVAFGVWEVFARIRRLRGSLADPGAEHLIGEQAAGYDEVASLAVALTSSLAQLRQRGEAEAERAAGLAEQQELLRELVALLDGWLARTGGAGSVPERPRELAAQLGGDTPRQIVALAELASRLLAERGLRSEIASLLGTVPALEGGLAELGGLLRSLIHHDAAYLAVTDPGEPVRGWRIDAAGVSSLARPVVEPPEEVAVLGPDTPCPLTGELGAAALVLPLRVEQRAVGVLLLCRRQGGFGEADVEAAGRLAPMLASPIARMAAEARLRTAENLAVLGGFARLLAHEVRNPLNTMSLQLQILERAQRRLGLPAAALAETAAQTRTVHAEIERLDRLVDEFLALSPVEGKTRFAATDLRGLVQEVLDGEDLVLARRGVTVTLDLGGEPAIAEVDPAQIRKALRCLVQNAADAMDGRPERRLSIGLRAVDRRYEIHIADTGPGMREPERAASAARPARPSGTGIGMALSLQIARLHQGNLVFLAAPGGGAEAVFSVDCESRTAALQS